MGNKLEFSQSPLKRIADLVGRHYSVSRSEIYGMSRKKRVVTARQVTMYISRHLMNWSYPEIGEAFGRDHTTARNACEKVANLRTQDVQLNNLIEWLMGRLRVMVDPTTTTANTPYSTEVVFGEGIWRRLKALEETGLFGKNIDDVIERLVSRQLYELERLQPRAVQQSEKE